MVENILNLLPAVYDAIVTQYREQGLNDEDIMDLFEYKLNYHRIVWASDIKTKRTNLLYLPKDLAFPLPLHTAIKKDKFNEFKESMRLFRAGVKYYKIERKLLEIEEDF